MCLTSVAGDPVHPSLHHFLTSFSALPTFYALPCLSHPLPPLAPWVCPPSGSGSQITRHSLSPELLSLPPNENSGMLRPSQTLTLTLACRLPQPSPTFFPYPSPSLPGSGDGLINVGDVMLLRQTGVWCGRDGEEESICLICLIYLLYSHIISLSIFFLLQYGFLFLIPLLLYHLPTPPFAPFTPTLPSPFPFLTSLFYLHSSLALISSLILVGPSVPYCLPCLALLEMEATHFPSPLSIVSCHL